MERWVLDAILAMLFAGVTAVIAKAGLAGITAEAGLAVRTCFVFLFVLLFASFATSRAELSALTWSNILWLALSAATTAASVGVKTPIFRPTSTITGSISAQVDERSACQRSWLLALGGGWMFSFLATMYQATAMLTAVSAVAVVTRLSSFALQFCVRNCSEKSSRPVDLGGALRKYGCRSSFFKLA